MKKLLRRIKRLANKIFGTKIDELYWEFRHVFDKKWAESYISEESINHPHRKFLIEKISNYFPLESVLEIGCASGPNLYLLAKKFPGAEFYGIDISRKAIEIGKDFFKKEKINNVFLNIGKADKLKKFKDKSIDLIFTDATLIYLAPDKISRVIKEMLRVAKKAIILNEWHSNSPQSFYDGHWLHNYKVLFNKFVEKAKINFTKLPEEKWTKYGYLVEIKI